MSNRRDFTKLAAFAALGAGAQALLARPAMAQDAAVTAEQATAWLAAYGKAWETKDSALVLTLFTPDANYRDSAFVDPMVGAEAIKTYWDTVTAGQKDISFQSELWAVTGNVAIAHWAAQFTAVPGDTPAKLDGVFHLTFADVSGGIPVASQLLEWWFYA